MKMQLVILTTAGKLPAINPAVAQEEPAKGGFQIGVLTCNWT
jgi:hypothetical protein